MDTGETRCVLVTGGRGFLGRAMAKLLQRTGYEVVSLDVSPITTSSADPGNDREVLCDLTDAEELQRVFETRKIQGIIHLAAILPTAAQRDPAQATRVNIDGSLNLLEHARRFGVRRMVFGSSLSVYGTRSADHVVSETDRRHRKISMGRPSFMSSNWERRIASSLVWSSSVSESGASWARVRDRCRRHGEARSSNF